MKEFDFIKSIKQSTYSQPSLMKGVGDDAAVFRQRHADIVTAVDTFVEGVHFTKETMRAYDVGYRALAANISDIAAMGATPVMYLVSVVFPNTWTSEERLHIMNGMKELAQEYRMDMIGGDTVSGDTFVLSITIIGYVHPSNVRYRSTAQDNDVVFVTGTLGDAAAGLAILLNQVDGIKNDKYFIHRHTRPTPRVTFAEALHTIDRVTLNDVSDGIANEATEIAQASQVDIYLYDEKIPVSTDYNQFSPMNQYNWKYFGGEDFEMLGTVARGDWETVQLAAKTTGVDVTAIGAVMNGSGQVYLEKNGTTKPLPKKGYQH